MKNINKLIIYLFLPLVSSLFFACDNFLGVPPDNRTSLDSEIKVRQLLVSAYPNATSILISELISDNMVDVFPDKADLNIPYYTEIYYMQDETSSDYDDTNRFWESCYSSIANANLALNAINEMGNPSSLMDAKGEALVTRAYAHFLLVNLFARHYNEETSATDLGIPYMKTSEKTLNPKYERITVSKVYEMIEQDLIEGFPLLESATYNVPSHHFTKNAASAFAARFFLYYGKFEKAELYANMVLANNPKEILFDWENLGNQPKEEQVIAALSASPASKANLLVSDLYSAHGALFSNYGYASRISHNSAIAKEETVYAPAPWGKDGVNIQAYRFEPFEYTNSADKILFYKIPYIFQAGRQGSKVGGHLTMLVPFRTDETLLVRAEAKMLQGNLTDAIADLQLFYDNFFKTPFTLSLENIRETYENMEYSTSNKLTPKKKLHPKAPLMIDLGSDQEYVAHTLLHLRRLLTLHEGLRWYDIKRYGIEIYKQQYTSDGVTREVKLTVEPHALITAIQLPSGVIGAGLTKNPR